MSQVAIDFTNDFSRYEQVLFQRAKVVLDGELNEIGRLQRVSEKRKELVEMVMYEDVNDCNYYAVARGLNYYTRADDPGITGVNQLVIEPQSGQRCIIKACGYVFELTGQVVFPTVTFIPNGDPLTKQLVYIEIDEVEETSIGNPAIKTSKLGETAVRVKLNIQWKIGAIGFNPGTLNTVNEPWEGGKRAVPIFEIRKDRAPTPQDLAHTEVFPLYHVPQQAREMNREFMNPQVYLRSSMTGEQGDGAYAYYKSGSLTISRLAVQLGFGFFASEKLSYITAEFGQVEVSLPSGSSLVLRVPGDWTKSENLSGAFGSASDTSYRIVIGTTPASGEIRADVVDMYEYSRQDIGFLSLDMDPSTAVVICTNMTYPSEIDIGLNNAVDIVFADGKRIVRRNSENPRFPESEGYVRWGFGNRWDDWLPPNDYGSLTRTSDIMPWWRTYITGQEGSLKLIEEHISSVYQPEVGAPEEIVIRRYSANHYVMIIGNEANTYFSGFIETVNARWDPGNAGSFSTLGQWIKDTGGGASIRYDGVNTQGGTRISGFAAQAGSAPDTWTSNHWNDGGGGYTTASDDSVHVYHTPSGSMVFNGSFTSDHFISGLRRVQFKNADQPIVTGGVIPPGSAVSTRSMYSCLIPVAYGNIKSNGGGASPTITIGNGSFGVLSATYNNNGASFSTVNITLTKVVPSGMFIFATPIKRGYTNEAQMWLVTEAYKLTDTSFAIGAVGNTSGDRSAVWETDPIEIQFIVFGSA